jgi:hypothetical protein
MKIRYIFLFIGLFLLQSCDRLSQGIIVNETNDTILIKLTANDVKEMKFNAGGKLFPAQYFDIFKDSVMINAKTDWKEPIFKGEFKLATKVSYIFGSSMGQFGTPSIHFDTLVIITKQDTLLYNSKKEIFKAFETTDQRWFYLKIESKNE